MSIYEPLFSFQDSDTGAVVQYLEQQGVLADPLNGGEQVALQGDLCAFLPSEHHELLDGYREEACDRVRYATHPITNKRGKKMCWRARASVSAVTPVITSMFPLPMIGMRVSKGE